MSATGFDRISRLTLAAGFALFAGVPAVVYAQADSIDEAAVSIPTLECSAIAVRIMAPEVSGARFVCHIAGAQSGDTRFTAHATADARAAGSARAPTCTGSLVGGLGDCVGGFVDRTGTGNGVGPFSVTAVLEPSGAALGPVSLGPAASTPPPPTAPPDYVPLPDEP